jgi:hypothetical protein
MFHSSKTRMRAWMSRLEDALDDVLGDAPAEAHALDDVLGDAHLDLEPWATHPHRRPLEWKRPRRGGSVPPPPAHCLCPVRATPDFGGRTEVVR